MELSLRLFLLDFLLLLWTEFCRAIGNVVLHSLKKNAFHISPFILWFQVPLPLLSSEVRKRKLFYFSRRRALVLLEEDVFDLLDFLGLLVLPECPSHCGCS